MQEYKRRYLSKHMLKDLSRKMVFVAGPRQCGKTTLAMHLLAEVGPDTPDRYFNWDADEDRERILRNTIPYLPGCLVFDEIHKYADWRGFLKGLYDKRGDELNILVTGSARLDYYRRGGDSLQGRYHFYRLCPFTVKELGQVDSATVNDLLIYGGFPEPFLLQSERETRRWSREYRSRIVREDLQDIERVHEVDTIEKLALRLPECVGSPLSINSLREDLSVSHKAVTRWISILENLYMIFRVYPFGAPIIRAVKKEAKHYHFDWTTITDPAARFENLIAMHLLKWCFFQQDVEGFEMELRYFRDIERREVDFVLTENGAPRHFIECKLSSGAVSRSLRYLKSKFPGVRATQVCLHDGKDYLTGYDIRVCPAHVLLDEFV